MLTKRLALFLLVCCACAFGLFGYLSYVSNRTPAAAVLNSGPQIPASGQTHAGTDPSSSTVLDNHTPSANGRIFFRYNAMDSHYGKLAFSPLTSGGELQFIDQMDCEVVHVSGGKGSCLTADRGVFTTYEAQLFDASTYQPIKKVPLKGIPSRTRVSRDGSVAASTVFVTGHGYTSLDFSTQTLLIATATGEVLADLETFKVTKDGHATHREDFNFWGVTFTPDTKHFYATLSTAGKHYLIKADIGARSAEIIHDNVECPSLSPDATRVAYKKRFNIDNRIVWQLHILDLASGRELALSEKRSIDDQLEWLDDQHVLYSVPAEDASGASTDVWVAPADASEAPRIFLRNAYSPAVARTVDS